MLQANTLALEGTLVSYCTVWEYLIEDILEVKGALDIRTLKVE